MTSNVSASFAEGLGALALGPCVLSAGPGIGIGLRCAFAYLDGLLLSVEIKAVGQAARDAYESDIHPGSRGGHRHRPLLPRSQVRLSVPASAAGTRPDGELLHRLVDHFDSRAQTGRGYSQDDPGTPAYVQDLDVWWPTTSDGHDHHCDRRCGRPKTVVAARSRQWRAREGRWGLPGQCCQSSPCTAASASLRGGRTCGMNAASARATSQAVKRSGHAFLSRPACAARIFGLPTDGKLGFEVSWGPALAPTYTTLKLPKLRQIAATAVPFVKDDPTSPVI